MTRTFTITSDRYSQTADVVTEQEFAALCAAMGEQAPALREDGGYVLDAETGERIGEIVEVPESLTDAARALFSDVFANEIDVDERPTMRGGEAWLSYADGQWRGWLPVEQLNEVAEHFTADEARAEARAAWDRRKLSGQHGMYRDGRSQDIERAVWQRCHDLLDGAEDWLAGLDTDDAARRLDPVEESARARAWISEARDLDEMAERIQALADEYDAESDEAVALALAEMLAQAPPLPTFGGAEIVDTWHALVSWDAERVLEWTAETGARITARAATPGA